MNTNMKQDPLKTHIFDLMRRYNRLGDLLAEITGVPLDTDVLADPVKLAEVKMMLAEMNKVRAELDVVLGAKSQ